MIDFSSLLLLLGIGVASGFLNVVAGGGSTLVLPLLIFLGMDSTTANGTNRIAIITQNIAAVKSFEVRNYFELKESTRLSLLTLPGAIGGAFTAVHIDDELFQKILAVIMILTVVSMFVSPTGTKRTVSGEDRRCNFFLYPAMVAIGFYGGFIQVGVGFLIMAALYHILRLDLIRVNMHKVFIVLIYTLPAFGVFVVTGNVNWVIGLVVGIGSAVGGWWAAHASVAKGEKLIRWMLTIAIVVMAMKLLDVF